MKEQELKRILTELAETAIPARSGVWPTIQARVRAQKQRSQPPFIGLSGSWLSMKKIVVIVVLVSLLIPLSVLALTPAVQAQVLAAIGFTISGVEDNFLYPTYLPEGFSESAWVELDSAKNGDNKLEHIEQKYHNGSQFVIIIEDQAGDDRTLPEGRQLMVKEQTAVLVEGLSGTVEVGVTFQVDKEAGEVGEVQVIDENGQSQPTTENFEVVRIKSTTPITIDYTHGRRLIWYTDELRLEMLTNLPEAELLKIAESLALQ